MLGKLSENDPELLLATFLVTIESNHYRHMSVASLLQLSYLTEDSYFLVTS